MLRRNAPTLSFADSLKQTTSEMEQTVHENKREGDKAASHSHRNTPERTYDSPWLPSLVSWTINSKSMSEYHRTNFAA
jgi:hypothetical protein